MKITVVPMDPQRFQQVGVGDCFLYDDGLWMRLPVGVDVLCNAMRIGAQWGDTWLAALNDDTLVQPVRINEVIVETRL